MKLLARVTSVLAFCTFLMHLGPDASAQESPPISHTSFISVRSPDSETVETQIVDEEISQARRAGKVPMRPFEVRVPTGTPCPLYMVWFPDGRTELGMDPGTSKPVPGGVDRDEARAANSSRCMKWIQPS